MTSNDPLTSESFQFDIGFDFPIEIVVEIYVKCRFYGKYSRFDLYLTLEWPQMTFWHRNLLNLTPNLASPPNLASKYMYNAGILVSIPDLTFWWPLYDLKWPWNIFFWIPRKKRNRLICISYRVKSLKFISCIFYQLVNIYGYL